MFDRPLTAAERQRRYRARRKQGCFVVPVELTEADLNMLTAGAVPWLDEKDAHDPRACGAAIRRILDGLSRSPLRVTPKGPERD